MRWSHHAEARRAEMGLTCREVMDVVRHPEAVYPSPAQYGPNRRVLLKGRLAVVISDETNTIVTVLWRAKTGR